MKRLDCGEVEKLIVFDLDEGLDPDKKELLESHVQGCASCMKVWEEYRSLFSSVEADVPPEPGEEFWRRYDSTLAAALREKETQAGYWGFRWNMAGALFAAVLAVAAVFTSFYDFQNVGVQKQTVAEKLVIQELDGLYGPASEDLLPTLRDSMVVTEAKISRSDDTVLEWFEVEDGPSNLLL